MASPFTIDSERLVRYMTPDEARRGPTQAARDKKWAQRCADALVAGGLGWRNGHRLDVQNLVEIDPSRQSDTAVRLTHTATLTERQSGKRYDGLVAVLPEDVRCTLGNVQPERAVAPHEPRRPAEARRRRAHIPYRTGYRVQMLEKAKLQLQVGIDAERVDRPSFATSGAGETAGADKRVIGHASVQW